MRTCPITPEPHRTNGAMAGSTRLTTPARPGAGLGAGITGFAVVLGLLVGLLGSVSHSVVAGAQVAPILITDRGVGDAVLGSTVDELRAQLGSEYTVGEQVRITVDFDGHVVSRGGEVQFRAVSSGGTADALDLFIVNNQTLATAEGVGPGMSIAEAEAIYGDATLRWDPDDRGREFVTFAAQPADNLLFRTPGIAGTHVGVYAEGETETTDYEPDGFIAAVWLSCDVDAGCPDPDAAPGSGDDAAGDAGGGDDAAGDAGGGDDAAGDAGGGDDAAGDDDAAAGDGQLADTGNDDALLVTSAMLLVLAGGMFGTLHRNYLAPRWLALRR